MATSSVVISQETARKELARRSLARRHLVDFAEYIAPWYAAAAHHRLVAELLEQVETYVRTKGQTGIGRLMVFMPPRHGKTEMVSRLFPAWLLGKQPDARIILTSYNADLASKNSRAARDYVLNERYRPVFGSLGSVDEPVRLSEDSRSVTSWDLASPHRGGVAAAGVGGGITGMGAHLLVVDDPFKNREEAESEAQRDRVFDWFRSSAYTRLEDGGAVVVMHTRWHQDDLAGKLIKEMANDPRADRWIILNLPAIWEPPAVPDNKTWDEYQREKMLDGVYLEQSDPLLRKPGQALWPRKYDEGDLEHFQVAVGQYDWGALYQQNPYLRSGSLFRREDFTVVDLPPKNEDIVGRIRGWDKAGNKSGTGGDYAAGVLMSITKDDIIYVEHVVRRQCTPLQREEELMRCARNDRQLRGNVEIWHQQDPGTAGLESAQNTNKRLAKEGFTAHFETMSGDKTVRAGPWATAVEGGQVRVVRGAWNEAFIEEHVAFPKGAHDDQVDVAAFIFNKLSGGAGGWIAWANKELEMANKELEKANA